jgi:HAD superfamily hydrolase (TIGR01509 family)
MDGVIVHSNPVHREAWVAYNNLHGLETTEAMHQFMYGKRNDQIVRSFYGASLTPAEVFAHGAAKEALYRDMIRPLLPGAFVPGLRAFIERHTDLAIGLGTNAEPPNVKFILEESGLGPFFQAIVDGHQVERAKPAPDIYLEVARRLAIAPEDCVVFEDSHSGVAAGMAAGMRVVGVRTTHHDFEGVSLTIDDFNDPALEPWMASQRAFSPRAAIHPQ